MRERAGHRVRSGREPEVAEQHRADDRDADRLAEALRGAESGSALRQLVRLGVVAVQRGESEQREVMYSTTPRFLTLFQLRSLDDLPRTQDLQKL